MDSGHDHGHLKFHPGTSEAPQKASQNCLLSLMPPASRLHFQGQRKDTLVSYRGESERYLAEAQCEKSIQLSHSLATMLAIVTDRSRVRLKVYQAGTKLKHVICRQNQFTDHQCQPLIVSKYRHITLTSITQFPKGLQDPELKAAKSPLPAFSNFHVIELESPISTQKSVVSHML